MGGMVLETNMTEIITRVEEQNKLEKQEVTHFSFTCLCFLFEICLLSTSGVKTVCSRFLLLCVLVTLCVVNVHTDDAFTSKTRGVCDLILKLLYNFYDWGFYINVVYLFLNIILGPLMIRQIYNYVCYIKNLFTVSCTRKLWYTSFFYKFYIFFGCFFCVEDHSNMGSLENQFNAIQMSYE